MTMTKAQRVRLGLFVVAGLALMALFVLFVVGVRLLQPVHPYTVTYPGNVSGLEVGSEVRYQGLRVGSVEAMRVAPDNSEAIEIRLALDPTARLHEGTEAVLEFSGITGLKTVNLVPGDPRKPLMGPGSEIPPGSSFVQRITGEAEAIAAKVERLANNLLEFTGPDNQRNFETLLGHLTEISAETELAIKELREPAKKAVAQMTETGEAVGAASRELARTLRTVRDDAKAALVEAQRALGEARRVLGAVDSKEVERIVGSTKNIVTRLDEQIKEARLAETLADAQVALVHMTDMLDEVDLVVRAGRQDLLLSLKAVRESSENLREFSRLIASDPSLLFRGAKVGER